MINYNRIGNTDMTVSQFCIGSAQFGWFVDEEDAHKILSAYYDLGGNFFDTSNDYSKGVSEQIIGNWLENNNLRSKIILATKVFNRMWDGKDGAGLSKSHIIKACEDSLKRLKTDYIDLYYAHSDDMNCPIEETVEAFDSLIQSGKVRYVGCSNFCAERLEMSLLTSLKQKMAKYVCVQPPYSLITRKFFDGKLEDVCKRYSLGVVGYSPLAQGFLSGKYFENSILPATPRAPVVANRFFGDKRNWNILNTVKYLANKYDVSPVDISYSWILRNSSITSIIAGVNNIDQLNLVFNTYKLKLDKEDIDTLNDVSRK